MHSPQEHLPRPDATKPEERWGFALEDFLNDNWPYLVGLAIVLAVFFYARYSWRKRHGK